MKKKNRLFLILLVLICSNLFCSYSKNKYVKVTGYIHVYGNEPFTYLGIKTIDNKEYEISANEEQTSMLWKTQGTKIEITGIILPKKETREFNMLKDGKIEVAEWKEIK